MHVLGRAQQRTSKVLKGLEYISYEERLRKLEQFSLEKRSLGAHLSNVYRKPKGGCIEDDVRLFSVVPSARTRGSGYKLGHKMLCLILGSTSSLLRW